MLKINASSAKCTMSLLLFNLMGIAMFGIGTFELIILAAVVLVAGCIVVAKALRR